MCLSSRVREVVTEGFVVYKYDGYIKCKELAAECVICKAIGHSGSAN
jgi:hypothetical protein